MKLWEHDSKPVLLVTVPAVGDKESQVRGKRKGTKALTALHKWSWFSNRYLRGIWGALISLARDATASKAGLTSIKKNILCLISGSFAGFRNGSNISSHNKNSQKQHLIFHKRQQTLQRRHIKPPRFQHKLPSAHNGRGHSPRDGLLLPASASC